MSEPYGYALSRPSSAIWSIHSRTSRLQVPAELGLRGERRRGRCSSFDDRLAGAGEPVLGVPAVELHDHGCFEAGDVRRLDLLGDGSHLLEGAGVVVGGQTRRSEVVVVHVHDRHRHAVGSGPELAPDAVGVRDLRQQVAVERLGLRVGGDAVGRGDDRTGVDHVLQGRVLAEDHVGQVGRVTQAVLVLLEELRVAALGLDRHLHLGLRRVVVGGGGLERLLGERVVGVPDRHLGHAGRRVERVDGAVLGLSGGVLRRGRRGLVVGSTAARVRRPARRSPAARPREGARVRRRGLWSVVGPSGRLSRCRDTRLGLQWRSGRVLRGATGYPDPVSP